MHFLNKEYTKYNSDNTSWKNGLFSAAVILVFFALFQPFGFRDKTLELRLLLYPGYFLIAFFYSISTFYVIRKVIKSKRKWTLKNEICSFVISMFPLVFLVHIYSHWISGDLPLNIYWFFKLYYHIASLILLISAIEYLYYNNKSADIKIEHLSSQIQLYSHQTETAKKEKTGDLVTISLEKGSMPINRDKLVFIESKGNYLEFFVLEKEGVQKKLIKRGRLHQAESDLKNYLEFFRCHRAFIVNLKHAYQIKGQSKNARLSFKEKFNDIPVSRSRFKTLKEKLEIILTT